MVAPRHTTLLSCLQTAYRSNRAAMQGFGEERFPSTSISV